MSEQKCNYNKIKDYETAFRCFEQRFLKDKKSIFRLDCDDDDILNKESIEYLVDNFIEQGLDGDKGISFINKIELQLKGIVKIGSKDVSKDLSYPENINDDDNQKKVQREAIEVLAHCIWLWRLVPSNGVMNSTIKGVKEVLNLDESLKNLDFRGNPFFNEKIEGIAKTGTYYNTNKPFELAFVIKFLHAYLAKLNNKSEINLLNDLVNNCDKKDCEIYIKTVGKLTKDGLQTVEEETVYKTASIFNALLFFFDPDNYEAIVSNSHKKEIVEAFKYLLDNECTDKFKPEIDWKLKCIKKELIKNSDDLNFFYKVEIKEKWNPSILPAKNVIYYGVPGTGKTHDILKLVKSKIKAQCKDAECLENYYEVVQFHPSYSYEDFIDGIKPVKSASNINLELVDGVFKKMCRRAYTELETNPKNPKKFYFIADEINRAELSRVFGELLLCIEEDKRLSFKEENGKFVLTSDSVMIKTQNSTLWKDENAVVVVDTDKCTKENGLYFGVPENIYFLATMNDIDKSIDSFDLALRRRFKWVYKGCDYDVIYNELLKKGVNDDDIVLYVTDEKENTGRCNLLNQYISKTLNLGSSYELGHSYFMNIKTHGGKIPKNAYENLFDQEIAPLVSEYLRAKISNQKELKDNLACMKKIFTTGE